VSDTYAGLGGSASISLNLNPQLTAFDTYKKNIDQATGRMGVTQTAMTQIEQIAATFAGDIPNLDGINPSEVDSIAANARSALQQVAGLLNTKNGDVYVFGGQDTANPPVPDPTTSCRQASTPRSTGRFRGFQAATHPPPPRPRWP
jgi:flagellar hook-associated protein 3 FlgL